MREFSTNELHSVMFDRGDLAPFLSGGPAMAVACVFA